MAPMTRRGFVKGAALAPLALTSLGAMAQEGTAVPGERFDFVIAGAGHNSLVCSAYLAKAGYRVLVLEGRPTIGGGCKTQEVCMPGFKEDLCSSVHGAIQNNPLLRDNELDIRQYGLEYIDPDPVMHIPFEDGHSITVWRDLERTCATIGSCSKKDADTFRRLVPEYEKVEKTPPAQRAKLPRAGYWQRLNAMSGYEAVGELFESRYMRSAALACGHFGGVAGSDPRTGGQAFSMIGQVLAGRPIPKGGSGMLSVALGRFIEAHHGVILTNKPVVRLVIEGGKCKGVECMDGSKYMADKGVVSTIHVKHLVKMAPQELWGEMYVEDVRIFQPEEAMFSFHYAMKEPPKYPVAGGGTISTCESTTLEHPDSLFRLGYDNARGVANVEDIPLQIVSPSVADASRAPAGYHTVKIESTLPYGLKEGPEHWDKIKEEVAAKIFARLGRLAPNLTPDKILGKFLESPIDIERMDPAMWRGSVHHGDRRIPQFVEYRSPIPGLYQTGACTFPGGSISGMPGRNAAAAILQDQGTSIEKVVGKKSEGA
jgi:beta-carotene ketolase (CrtO type)